MTFLINQPERHSYYFTGITGIRGRRSGRIPVVRFHRGNTGITGITGIVFDPECSNYKKQFIKPLHARPVVHVRIAPGVTNNTRKYPYTRLRKSQYQLAGAGHG